METDRASEIQISVIRSAYERGLRIKDITPDMQLAQWLVIGIKRMEENGTLSEEELAKIHLMGGTDHPDPTLGV